MYGRYSPGQFKAPREIPLEYSDFRGGWNNLFRPNELRKNELAQADNLVLTGLGVPTKRMGSQDYFLAGATGYGRGLFSAKSTAGTIEVLAVTDWGQLTKKNGASYTPITGASWPSGYNVEAIQLNNNVYFNSEQRELVKYDFSTLQSFVTIGIPTGIAATNLSSATGSSTYSWRISAVTRVGETLGSTPLSFASLPQDLRTTVIRLNWTPVSAASGVLTGYNVYRGAPGDEVYIGSVDEITTRFDDVGVTGSILRQPPTADTTGGPRAKFSTRYQDRIVLGGIPGETTKVIISGRVPNHERFDWAGGGGYVQVDPATGDDITGLSVHQGRIIVYKENSVWQVTLGTTTIGNFLVLEPAYQLITAAQGCMSHRSIVAVDNDLLFLGRKGVYVLGYEPNITGDVLRTNELSAKIRPFFESLSDADLRNATGIYFDYKYILAFPNAKKCIVFDKERIAWMGPWSTTFGINKFIRHVDEGGVERLLCVDTSDNYVTEFSKTLIDDKGVAFGTTMKTKKDDLGNWYALKTINDNYFNFRNISGSVNVSVLVEDKEGNLSSQESFTVTGPTTQTTAAWGTDLFGEPRWGVSEQDAQSFAEETIKRALIYKTGRYIQFEISTEGRQDNYELLNIRARATLQGEASSFSYNWNTSEA